jgi:hypothetical protein
VSGLIDKSFGIAKTQIAKKIIELESFVCGPSDPLHSCAASSAGALKRGSEKPFGARGLRWYALPNETNDQTSGMRRSWRLARFSGKLQ